MFNLGSGGLLAGQHDCHQEREPPPRPTPLTFPTLPSLSPAATPSPDLPARLLALKKPADVDVDVLKAFNVSFQPIVCDFDTLLLSVSEEAVAYLPPVSWFDPPEKPAQEKEFLSGTRSALSNGRKPPTRKEFHTRLKELYFENADAFANLTRKTAPGQAPLRLAYFRKFWEGLDNMAYYWDTTLDEYLPPKLDGANSPDSSQDGTLTEEPRKKAKTLDETTKDDTPIVEAQPTSIRSSNSTPARTAPPRVPWANKTDTSSEKRPDKSQGTYRGYRIGNGPQMPEQYRLECVRSFLEAISWPFGVTFSPHRRPPVLCVKNIKFPVRMNTTGWRAPLDRTKARQSWIEGPVLGIQCRPDTSFGFTGSLEKASILDMTRELGGLLLLAQERAREGKTEKQGGEEKWWVTRPRWGGGPGGEVGEAAGANDNSQSKTEEKPEKPEKLEKLSRVSLGTRERRRPSPIEQWKTLKPGFPVWDPRTVYEAIGKDPDVEWDEVFMISSLNHHISVLKLRVHPLYTQYLLEGNLPNKSEAGYAWASPVLHRTRWYDLFNVRDRVEAMRGLWGVMGYLMRSREKGDLLMSDG